MNSIQEADNTLQTFKQLSDNKNPQNLAQRESLLRKLKILLTQFETLPPSNVKPNPKELIIARETYEYAALLAIEKGDVDSFERYVQLLKSYYEESSQNIIPESQRKYAILGLYLVNLLSSNRIAEYHTEIELIPIEQQNNLYIKVALSVEQYFVEGNYHKILNTNQNVPIPEYHFFLDKFVDTVRYETARSAERAYDSLTLRDAAEIFMLNSENDVYGFVNKESENGEENRVDWKIQDGRLHFIKVDEEKVEIPTEKMISISLNYALELEKIV